MSASTIIFLSAFWGKDHEWFAFDLGSIGWAKGLSEEGFRKKSSDTGVLLLARMIEKAVYFDYPGNDDDGGGGVHGFDYGVQVAR